MQIQKYSRYNALLLGATLVLLSLATGIAILIDPYGYYHGARWSGINEIKPKAYVHARLTKQTFAQRANPRTVILGNSRMDIGFDPLSPVWPAELRPIFNFAIPGHGLSGDLKNLNASFSKGGLRTAVIGLEFLDFLFDGAAGPRRPEASPTALQNLVDRLTRFSETALSLTAFIDSIDTLRQRKNRRAPTMTNLGFNPLHQYLDYVDDEGHAAIFRQKNNEYVRRFSRLPSSVVAMGGVPSPNFERLSKLIEWCRQRGVRVRLVIYPYHMDILEAFYLTGLWPAFEEWKRRVTRIVAAAGQQEERADIELWDFSGFHRYTSEKVPASGDTDTHMRWYWEAGHFKSSLGDRMLGRMLRGDAESSFGDQLKLSNIEGVLARIREDGRVYRARYPDSYARVSKILNRLRPTAIRSSN